MNHLHGEGRIMGASRASRLRMIAAVLLTASLTLGAVGCSAEFSCGEDEETTTTAAAATTTAAPTTTTTAASTTTAPVSTSVPSTEAPTTTTTGPSTTATTEVLSSAETRLPNGDIKGMGFITKVWEKDGVRYLSIDYAEMLTGEEARQAAIEAGVIEPDEDLPNDYFIRNVNTKLREFTISPAVAITTATRWAPNDGPAAPCTWEEFVGFWGPGPLPDGDTQLHAVPWWIVRTGTEVHSIEEQYIP
jgi:hypothetical protein